jgi:DNA topoisomerase-1
VQLGETPDKGSKEKPKRASLTGGMTESTVTIDEAMKLLELPRELGAHPESGQPVVAGLGRFGPYVKHGDDYRSLTPDDDLFTVGLARALALFAEPKKSGRRQMTKRVIRQIEATDGGKGLQVLEGRYGPYVTDGETNASLPNGTDPTGLSLEDARALIEARRGAPPRAKRGRAAAGTSRPRRPGRSSEPAGVTAAARAPAKRKPTKRKTAH